MLFQKVFGQISDDKKLYKRDTVRAIIFKDNQLLMVRTNMGDYKFPGGKKEEGESDYDAVAREVLEETGYQISSVKRLLGEVIQQHEDIYDKEANFKMTSLYYLCTLKEEAPQKQMLDQYEKELEFQPVFVSLEDAIKSNEQLSESSKTIQNLCIARDTYVLQELRKNVTHIYFIRHAQPDFSWKEDISRPLTQEGLKDSKQVTKTLQEIRLNFAMSSPYKRSIDTILECVEQHGLELKTDKRLRERESGEGQNVMEMFQKRWFDFSYHENGGESLEMVQKRNMEALHDILNTHKGENIILGTHGTALSTILNYYDSSYHYDSFLRIINFMPYILRLDFIATDYIGQEEILIIEKEYKVKIKDK